MAENFSPTEYLLRRALDNNSCKSVEVPISFTHLSGDEQHSLIVAVDGACRKNGRPGARAALGIFFGEGSPWNRSELLPLCDATSQRAELCAVLRTLELLRDQISYIWSRAVTAQKNLNRVIIKSDSDYMVQSMTRYINKWVENDYTNARGQPVHNQDLFKKIMAMIHKLDEEKNTKVLFWGVGRKYNQEADRLANAAFDADDILTWDHQQSMEERVAGYLKRNPLKVWSGSSIWPVPLVRF